MPRPLISVLFTCKGRQSLTELCLRRFRELMPQPYELIIVYDGNNIFYEKMLADTGNPSYIINKRERGRFAAINDALSCASGEYIMHLENDFYWVDESCLEDALKALEKFKDIDFIRFELLPFTISQFNRFESIGDHDFCWMKPTTPYRFTFNPHIRRFKYINGKMFKDTGFTKQPEQHHNDEYVGTSVCMTGDNFRHLGIFDEGGHFKPYYAERFFNKRGKREAPKDEMVAEFGRITDNLLYHNLFLDYLTENV